MESYRKAKYEIIIPPRNYYTDDYDIPYEHPSLEGQVYARHDYAVISNNEKV